MIFDLLLASAILQPLKISSAEIKNVDGVYISRLAFLDPESSLESFIIETKQRLKLHIFDIAVNLWSIPPLQVSVSITGTRSLRLKGRSWDKNSLALLCYICF